MAKSAINGLVGKLIARIDYDISDTSLNTLVIEAINDVLKLIKQDLLDYGLYKDIAASTTLSTTASQAYVDISTITNIDEIIRLSERTNDKTIQQISYFDFIERYPDPTADTSNMPDDWALWNNRIYLGPTPSAVVTLYLDYIKLIDEVIAGDSLPFEDKYDPLILAWAREELAMWLDSKDSVSIASAKATRVEWEHKLIIGASKNIGQVNQSASRRVDDYPAIHPRMVK